MCILFIAYKQRSDFPLIIAANRDEFHRRPTRASGFWAEQPSLLAGKDLEAGGTWMGVNRAGHIAALTNIRAPEKQNSQARTRGELVTSYLCEGASAPADYAEKLTRTRNDYNGYNLLFGNRHRLQVYNNYDNQLVTLEPGIHGLSNANLNSPWPKVTRGMQMLTQYCESASDIATDDLFRMLRDNTPADDHLLPDTGIGYEWEKRLSSIFICSEEYGTRASTLLLVNQEGHMAWHEKQFDTYGKLTSSLNYQITA